MEQQNITLSLPRDLLVAAKHLAIEKGTSLSGMLAGVLREMVAMDRAHRRAQQSIERRLAEGLDLGTRGKTGWTRDELHER